MTNFSDLQHIKVREMMTTHVVTLLEDDSLMQAYRIFDRTHISGAPVMNPSGEYVGLITKTDLTNVRLLEESMKFHTYNAMAIKDFMNRTPLVTVTPEQTLGEAVQLMAEKRIHRVFVQDVDGSVMGVVSSFDVVNMLNLSFMDGINPAQPPEPSSLLRMLTPFVSRSRV